MNGFLGRMASRLTAKAPLISWRISGWGATLARIAELERSLMQRSDQQILKTCLGLKFRARSGEPLAKLLPETFALVREAARRTIAMRHYDVQILGGMALFHRSVAEMQTGEGKTVTATLPLALFALAGKGAHLATVNDYLARRDAEWMRPVYQCLGLSVGVVETNSHPSQRRAAYGCDVTYGTAKEFGFDFLRDRLIKRYAADADTPTPDPTLDSARSQCVQREHFFVLVDEADSVLIDDAGTPLVISAVPSAAQKREVEAYRFSATAAGHFVEEEHYRYDHEDRSVSLLPAGQRLARSLSQPEILRDMSLVTFYEFIERGIRTRRDFHRDQQYVVCEGQVVIVDEFTGRLAEGRKWRSGIHQAVEAQEGLEVTVDAGQAAQITIQDYFRKYQRLAGMTGTASTSAAELRKIYRLKVVQIPTNKPSRRVQLTTRVTPDAQTKWSAVVAEIRELHALGRPVLVGTRSIDRSLHLSRLLKLSGVEHQVLNAHQVEVEADIIAQAGQPGRVTVSTNMAGRGTDIRLGAGIAELGGLHVIATEMHEAQRIDRQLFGRCARQGDPGTVRQYVSLDDELLVSCFGPDVAARVVRQNAGQRSHASQAILTIFRRAQRRVERREFRARKALLYYQKHRRKAQREMGQDPYLDCIG